MSDPRWIIRSHLRLLRDAWPQEQADRAGLVYRGPADFVLREGRWWPPRPRPAGIMQGAPKACYGNAIGAAVKYGLRYVQGYAVSPVELQLVVPHAWNADADGNVVDLTWNPTGSGYLGVEMTFERADDATWNGDADPIDDYLRGWPLLQQPWPGKDTADPTWPPSPLLLALKAQRAGDVNAMLRHLREADTIEATG